jgi:molecular chaperone IbpA
MFTYAQVKEFWSNYFKNSEQFIKDFQKDLLDSLKSIFDTWSKAQSFPFYNVVKYSKGKYGLEIGLAGYNKENILVEVKDGILTVEGKVEDKNIDYVQKGLAFRKFFKQFELAKDAVIDEAEMKDGLLKIKLGFKEPKEVEGVKVDIK